MENMTREKLLKKIREQKQDRQHDQHDSDLQLKIDNISIAFFALIADEAGTISVEHEDVRAFENVIGYYLTQNK